MAKIAKRKRLVTHACKSLSALCAITSVPPMMEVVRGFQRNQSQRKLQNFLAIVAPEEVLALDHAAGGLADRIADELERIGQPIGLAAPMIASIALTHGLELITDNTAHFQRVRQLG